MYTTARNDTISTTVDIVLVRKDLYFLACNRRLMRSFEDGERGPLHAPCPLR
jgi:hypothetical protein